MKRRGFTLIELMIVVGLIALLTGLLVIGIGKLQTSSKRQQTQLIFHNLQALYSEYDAVRRLPLGMGNLNFSSLSAANQTAMLNAIYLACPANVTTGGTDRLGYGVQYTRYFMAQLLAMPNNASAISKFPTGSLMTFAGVNPTPAVWDYTKQYNIYDGCTYNGGNVYIRTQLYADSSGDLLEDGQANFATPASPAYTVNAPPNYSYWMPALVVPTPPVSLPTQVPLDAWNNPIIFVMGGVLGAPSSSTTGGFLTAGGNSVQVASPDYRPFWASAGPDGDFSKGDDNMYSFEK